MNIAVCRSARIINPKGLHARASAKLAKLALSLPVPITITHEGESADARSIMDLLCLGAAFGQTIELSAEGKGANEALDAVTAMIEDGFGELDESEA